MEKFRLRIFFALVGFACMLAWPGCSGNGVLTVTLTPSATPTIEQGQTQPITATVAHDKNNAGVTWSLSGDGSLTDITPTSVTYQAPAALPSATSVTVTATSVTAATATAALTITVNSVLTIVTTALPVGQLRTPYSGVISAGGSAGPFTWLQKSGSLPAGLSLSSSTSDSVVVSGTPTQLGSSSFTIQVSDATGAVATQAFTITINPPPPLSVATRSLAAGTVGVTYNPNAQALQAASGTPPYTWAITGGSLPPGLTMNSAGVISGVPTTVGTFAFTVQVTDATSPTPQMASAGLSIVVNPNTANNAELDGNYAFLVSGFSVNGHFVAAGSFFADGAGHISNGVMDTNDPLGPQLGQTFSGAYAIGSNNLGTMSMGARSFALSVMADGNAKIIEFDSSGTQDSGVLLKQTTGDFSQVAINGGYAFGFSGTDAVAARYALTGAMQADGAGHFSSGVLDANDAGVAQNVAFTGTYTGIDAATGRGTAAITLAGQGTSSYSFYIVSATQLLMMEIDFLPGQVKPIVSGSILHSAGNFSLASLTGDGVLQTSAIDVSGAPAAQSQVGLFNGDGGGNFNVSTDEMTGNNLSSPLCNGTYSTPDPTTGRTTLTYSGTACAENVLYLVAGNQGFVMGTDANVTLGFMEAQTGAPFAASSLLGNYAGGTVAPVLSGAATQVDVADSDGVSNLDFTTTSGAGQNQMSIATYSVVANGRGAITPTSGGHNEIFYMVSQSEFISLITDTGDATVEVFEH
ncbi:MAG: putative Ig domain-containing protein [Terriglobales bacterium]